MKILFLTPWYPHKESPNHGIFVRDQAIAVSKTCGIVVVSSRIEYSSFGVLSYRKEESVCEGVKEISISVRRSVPVFNQVNFFIVSIYATLKVARQFKPDVIHGNIGYPGAFWSWAVSKCLKVPYLITEHTKITNNFRSRFHRFLTLFGLRRAAAIVAVSDWHARDIESHINQNVRVIGNIIHVRRFNEVVNRPAGNPVHFGILGGMDTEVKGVELLLNACARIQEDYILHIGGTGKLLTDYQALSEELGIQHKCVFEGFIDPANVPVFMSQLHFYVSASKSETFGMVMAEALASGLPVVATDSGGSAGHLKDGNGILVHHHDVESLAEALTRMMRTYGTYDSSHIKASVDKYSGDQFVVKMTTVYNEILSVRG